MCGMCIDGYTTYPSRIEEGIRDGSLSTMKALAAASTLDPDDPV